MNIATIFSLILLFFLLTFYLIAEKKKKTVFSFLQDNAGHMIYYMFKQIMRLNFMYFVLFVFLARRDFTDTQRPNYKWEGNNNQHLKHKQNFHVSISLYITKWPISKLYQKGQTNKQTIHTYVVVVAHRENNTFYILTNMKKGGEQRITAQHLIISI